MVGVPKSDGMRRAERATGRIMLDRESIADMIGRTSLFQALAPEDRQAAAKAMREQTYAAGQVIFSRGDTSRDVFLVLEGKVRLSVVSLEGRELSFSLAEPGAVFGEIAALDGGARTADATAVVAGEAASLSRADLGRLISAHPGLRDAVLSTLCERLRATTLQLESVALMPLETRAARLLLAFARRSGTASRDGRVSFPCDVSQSELAALVGASRPKLNRVLMQFEADGLLARNGRVYAVDARGLAALAAEELAWA